MVPSPTPAGDRLIGLVEVPALWRSDGADAAAPSSAPAVVLRDAPRSSGAVVARVTSGDGLQSAEFDYEALAAVSYERRDSWHRVGLAGGKTAWLSPDQAATFHPYETLVGEGLAYFTVDWDGTVRSNSEGGGPLAVPPDPERGDARQYRPVKVRESRRTGDVLWLRTEVMTGSFCGEAPPRVAVSGWVRAHAPSGAPTVWFHSRGC